MRMRAIVALGVVTAMLLTGCTNTSVKDDIIVLSDVEMKESTVEVAEETKIIENTEEQETLKNIYTKVAEEIDVEDECFLKFPYDEGSYVPRVQYDVYAEDATHIRVKSSDGKFEELVELFSGDLFEMNNVGDGPIEEQKRLEQMLFAESGTLIAGSSEVSYSCGTRYHGKDCMLVLQPLASGRNTYFGWVETILSWDETGTYYVEMSNYLKDKETYYNNPENVVYDSKMAEIHHLYNDEYKDAQLVSSVQFERNDDYRLHIYTVPKDEKGYGELLYTFPDIREGNEGIGQIKDIYHLEQADFNDDGKLDIFAVARYMTEGGLCYDTRVYLCNGKEYVPDYEYMDELNRTYHLTTEEALDYPIHEILSGMTIFSGEISIDKEKELSYFAYCEPQKADYQIVIKDEEGKLFQAITYQPEDWWADSYEPKIQLQDVNRDGINDIWLYLGCSGNAVIDGWTCFVYDEAQQQYVEIEGFDELSNPYMNEWLRTGAKNGWGVYVRKVYEVEDTNLVLLETLTETNVEYEGKIWLYDEELYEKGELVSKKEGVYAEEITSGYWDSVLMNTEDENKE